MSALLAIFVAQATAPIRSSPILGTAEARCVLGSPDPVLLVDVVGLKDREGRLKLEVYPANDGDFLQDDNILVSQGKTFRRIDTATPAAGAVRLCVRLSAPGRYAVMVLHDRDSNHRFGLSVDGVGFGGNPKLRLAKPRAAEATVVVGPGETRERIVINYRRGLLAFGPLASR